MGRRAGRRSWGAVRQLPSGRWQARYPDPDRPGQRVTADRTFATARDAGLWLDTKRVDLERGDAVDDRAASTPLSAWWPGYLDSVRTTRTPATAAVYERDYRLRIEPVFGAVPVARIRPSHVDAWLLELKRSGVAASVVRRTFGILDRLLGLAERDGAIRRPPTAARTERLPRSVPKDRPVLSPAEVEAICRHLGHDVDRLLVRVLAYGGLRIGEVFALSRRAVDVEAGTVTVAATVTEVNGIQGVGAPKDHERRTVVLPRAVADELRAHLRSGRVAIHPDAPVFPNKDGRWRRPSVFRLDRFYPAVARWNDEREAEAAKVAAAVDRVDVQPHDLRATCASLLIDAGASVKDVQAHLGHADVATTLGIYARVRPGRADDLAARLDALLEEGRAGG